MAFNLGKLIGNVVNKVAQTVNKVVKKFTGSSKKSSSKKTSSSAIKKSVNAVSKISQSLFKSASKKKIPTPNFYGTNLNKYQRAELTRIYNQNAKKMVAKRKAEEEKKRRLQQQKYYKYGASYSMNYTFMSDAEFKRTAPLRAARKKELEKKKSVIRSPQSVIDRNKALTQYNKGELLAVPNPRMQQLEQYSQMAFKEGNYKLSGFITQMQATEEAYNQVVKGALPSKEFQNRTLRVQSVLNNSGYQHFGVTDNEFNRWLTKNTVRVKDKKGRWSTQFREDGKWTPLFGYDKDGNQINLAEDFHYTLFSRDAIERQQKGYNEFLMSMTADHQNTKEGEINSFSDAIRMGLSSEYSMKDAFKKFKSHISAHYLKPIRYGEWGILGNNLITDLAETMDLPAIGIKAIIKNKPYVYGKGEALIPGQKAWISSIGEEKQLALIKAGVFNNVTERNEYGLLKDIRTFRDMTDLELKALGITRKEFNTFKREYEQVIQWSSDKIADDIKAVKTAYTSNENYDVDTGNVFVDFLTEMVMDPTVLVGGVVASGLKNTAKEIASESVEKGLKKVTKDNLEQFMVKQKSLLGKDNLVKKYQPAINEFSRRLQNSLYTTIERNGRKVRLVKPTEQIKNEVDVLTKRMVNNAMLPQEMSDTFNEIVYKAIMSERSKSSFTLVKTAHYLKESQEAIERGLLKGVFVVPYATIKLPMTAVKALKGIPAVHNLSKKMALWKRQAVRNLDAHLTGNILDIDEYEKAIKNNFYSDLDKAFLRESQQKKVKAMEKTYDAFINRINRTLKYDIKSASEWEDFLNRLDEEVVNITNGKATSLTELKDRLSKQEFKDFEGYNKLKDKYVDYLEQIETVLEKQKEILSLNEEADLFQKIAWAVNTGTDEALRNAMRDLLLFRENTIRFDSRFENVVDKFVEDYAKAQNGVDTWFLKFDAENFAKEWKNKADLKRAEYHKVRPEFFKDADFKNVGSELFDKTHRAFKSHKFVSNQAVVKQILYSSDRLKSYVADIAEFTKGQMQGFKSAEEFVEMSDKFAEAIADESVDFLKVATAGEIVSKTETLLRDLNVNIANRVFPNAPKELFKALQHIKNVVEAEYESLKILEGNQVEYVRFQKDKFAVATEGLEDEHIANALDICNSSHTPLGNLLDSFDGILDRFSSFNSKELEELVSAIDENKLVQLYDLAGAADIPSNFFKELNGTTEGEVLQAIVKETNITDPVELIALIKSFKYNDIDKVLNSAAELKEQVNKANAFRELQEKLDYKNSNSPLDEVTNNAVLESLFHFTSRTPDVLVHYGSTTMESFISKVNTLLDTLYGTESIAIDKFRLQATNFDHPMYDKYRMELEVNSQLKEEISQIVNSSTFENPDNYLKNVMLQTILKDSDCIARYNELSALKDVCFVHLETTGLNARSDMISAVTFRKWQPIENPTLKDILNMLNSEDLTKTYQLELTRMQVKEVSNKTLDTYFANDCTVEPTMNAKRQAYANRFAESWGYSVKTEKELLEKVMAYLDDSYDKHTSNFPHLVFNSANGLDQNFLVSRPPMKHLDVSTSSIPHLQAVLDNSENVFHRLKSVTNSLDLTLEQENFIKEAVSEYSATVSKYSTTLRPFEVGKFNVTLKDLFKNLKQADPEHLKSFPELDALAKAEGNDEFVKSVKDAVEDIKESNRKIRANILLNPDKINSRTLDKEYLARYVGERSIQKIEEAVKEANPKVIAEINEKLSKAIELKTFDDFYIGDRVEANDHRNMMQLINKLNGESGRLSLAWKKYINQHEIENYFKLEDKKMYTKSQLRSAQLFTQSIDLKIDKFYKQNRHIEGRLEDFQNVIKFFKKRIEDKLFPEDELYFLKDIKVPSSEREAYLVAQEMYNRITGGTDNETVIKIISAKIPYSDIPKVYRESVASLIRLQLNLEDLDKVVPIEVRYILEDYKGNYHRDIFLNVQGGSDFLDLEDIVEEDLLLDAHIRHIEDKVDHISGLQILTKGVDEADMIATAQRSVLHELVEGIKKYRNLTKTKKYEFLEVQKKLRKQQRDQFSNQILDFCIADATLKNLTSHLLHHKGIMVVALDGSIEYVSKVNELKKLLAKSNPYVYSVESQGQLWIGLKKEYVNRVRIEGDSITKANEVPKMYIEGLDETFEIPKYAAIPYYFKEGETTFNIKGMDELVQSTADKIARLSHGGSVGSLNNLYSMRMHQNLYKSAPDDFIKHTLPVEYTLNPRFWHQATFDFNRIGSEEFFFKMNEVNDKDLLLQQYEVVKEMADRTTSERLFIEEFFGKETMDSLRAPFLSDMSDDEIAEAITKNENLVVVVLKDSHGASKSGFWVEEVEVPNGKALQIAEAEGAVLTTYDTFIYLNGLINKQEFSHIFLQIWSYAMRLFKAGQLFNPGTWTRNYLDATFKSAIETGTITDTLKYQLRGLQLKMRHDKMSDLIEDSRHSKFETDVDLDRHWEEYSEEYKSTYSTNKKSQWWYGGLSREDYHYLEGFFNNDIGGSVSKIEQKKIDLNTKRSVGRSFLRGDTLFKKGKLGDLVAEGADLLKELDEKQLSKLWDSTPNLNTYGFTKESFIGKMQEFKKLTYKDDTLKIFIDTTEQAKFNQVVDQLLEYGLLNVGGKGVTFRDGFDKMVSKMFLPQSIPEEIIRSGLLLQSKDLGLTYDMALRRIVDTQFGGPKSVREVYLSQVVPFYSFTKDNLLYWVKSVIEKPHLLRVVLNAWNELSWEEGQPTPEEYARGKVWNEALTDGSIELWDSDDASVRLKLNPSFLDAIGWFYNTPTNSLNSLNVFAKYGLTEWLYHKGAMQWKVFDSSIFRAYQENGGGFVNKYLGLVPLAGPLLSNIFSQADIRKKLSEGHGILDMLLYIPQFTSLFGVSAWQTTEGIYSDSFAGFLAKLEKQGKWWDPQLGKVVPLENRYQHNLSWNEIMIQQAKQGKLWDANLQAFVSLKDYTLGGLNRKFDFNKEGEWEEFCRLKQYYHGVLWDANQRKFVEPKDYISGGLNNKSLNWDEVCALIEKNFGEVWDSNQGAFVPKANAISGGLNRKDLTWNELTALKYALHGESWDYKNRKWVKVTEPIVKVSLANPVSVEGSNLFSLTRDIYFTLYGVVKNNVVETALLKTGRLPERGLVLTGNKEHDQAVFDYILGLGIGQRGVFNYTSGNAKGYWFKKRSVKPYYSKIFKYAKNSKEYVPYARKRFGNAFNFNGNAGLRMATSNKTAYDEYYKYSYRYNYNARVNPYFTSPAGYPDTSAKKGRSNPYRMSLSQYRTILGAKRT